MHATCTPAVLNTVRGEGVSVAHLTPHTSVGSSFSPAIRRVLVCLAHPTLPITTFCHP